MCLPFYTLLPPPHFFLISAGIVLAANPANPAMSAPKNPPFWSMTTGLTPLALLAMKGLVLGRDILTIIPIPF